MIKRIHTSSSKSRAIRVTSKLSERIDPNDVGSRLGAGLKVPELRAEPISVEHGLTRDYHCVERQIAGHLFRIAIAPTFRYEIDDQAVSREIWLDALGLVLQSIPREIR